MGLDYSKPGKLIVDMRDYVTKMLDEFKYEIKKLVKTPAGRTLI